MRSALLAALVGTATLAGLTAVACGGGESPIGDPLNTRETPTSGYDSPPSTVDTPPAGYDTPPAMNEAPPTEGDPANQVGGGSCIPCSGDFVCSVPSVTTTVTLALTRTATGGCAVTDPAAQGEGVTSPDGGLISDFPACDTGLPTSGAVDGVTYSVKRAAGGGFKVCVSGTGDAGFAGFAGAAGNECVTCDPTTEVAGSGNGSSQELAPGPNGSGGG